MQIETNLFKRQGNVVTNFENKLPAVILLSKVNRLAYEKSQPQFWRYAGEEADNEQGQRFKELLEDKNYVMFTAQNGTKEILEFIITIKNGSP